MENFPKSDYQKPPDHIVQDLAKLLPVEIQRHYAPGPEPGEYATRFYNMSDLVRLLMDTKSDVSDVSEGFAVHAIGWLVEREYLVPFTVAVRDPDRYGLPTLAEPWLSAVLNGRLLDTIAKHGPPDPLDEHYIKRLEATESEAYFATAAFWDWWQSSTPNVDNAGLIGSADPVAGEEDKPQVAAPKDASSSKSWQPRVVANGGP